MSERPDSEKPSGQDPDEGPEERAGDAPENPPQPPYPGWSVQQPQSGWAPPPAGPAQSGPGWQSGQAAQHGGNAAQHGGNAAASDQPVDTGWTTPGGAAQQSAPGAPAPVSGWGHTAGGRWTPPTAKPGVIPLRPLGVGEILDGAVTTIRRNPAPMLGLAAVVAAVVQLLGLLVTWLVFRGVSLPADPTEADTFVEIFGATALALGGVGFLIITIVNWIATVILTGMLTVVVSRAVLGEKITVGDAWTRTRPRLLRLLGLTIVYALIVATPAIVTLGFTIFAVASGAPDAAIGLVIVASILMVPLMAWLFVRYALAVPALMLESAPARAHHAGEAPQRIGIGKALRRSAELVRRSWWRVFGILILVWIVAAIVSYAVSLLFSIPTYFLIDPTDPLAATSMEALALGALSGIASTAITAPFLAGSVALLYVDRRIRREALDIELARAAGVSIPGRTDEPPSAQ